MNRRQIDEAARRAHLVFAAEGWRWGSGVDDKPHVPTEGEIALTIKSLLRAARKNGRHGYASSGRLVVQRDALTKWVVLLELGDDDD